MKQFIIILKTRIRLNTIKRYKPTGDNGLTIYYNSSVNRPEFDIFRFDLEEERDMALNNLDDLLL